jgi:hypothetical protein
MDMYIRNIAMFRDSCTDELQSLYVVGLPVRITSPHEIMMPADSVGLYRNAVYVFRPECPPEYDLKVHHGQYRLMTKLNEVDLKKASTFLLVNMNMGTTWARAIAGFEMDLSGTFGIWLLDSSRQEDVCRAVSNVITDVEWKARSHKPMKLGSALFENENNRMTCLDMTFAMMDLNETRSFYSTDLNGSAHRSDILKVWSKLDIMTDMHVLPRDDANSLCSGSLETETMYDKTLGVWHVVAGALKMLSDKMRVVHISGRVSYSVKQKYNALIHDLLYKLRLHCEDKLREAGRAGGTVDLHGFDVAAAERLVRDVVRSGCNKPLMIITGRGNNSKHGPVLKKSIPRWLPRNAKYSWVNPGAMSVTFV